MPIPINLDTVNKLYGLDLTSEELEGWFASRAEPVEEIRTSEDVVVSKVGRELYEKFFRGYTRKQWGLDPSELDKSVTARVPTRTNRDDRYFGDEYQFMPKHGYTRMFERMLDHPNINIMLQTDYRREGRGAAPAGHLHRADRRVLRLPLRQAALPLAAFPARDARQGMAPAGRGGELPADAALHPRHRVQAPHRAAAPEDGAHLRVSLGSRATPITRSRRPRTRSSSRSTSASLATPDVWFVGRLATYRYYNMDQIVGQALATFRRINEACPWAPTTSSVRW